MRAPLLPVSILLIAAPAWAAENAGHEFFESKVRPVLAKHCSACHTQTKLGGLTMVSREALLHGGNSGPALIPGDPEASLLIQAVRHSHERLKMPPQEKLSEAEIAALETWIRDGAVWPAAAATAAPSGDKYHITPEQRAFWSFRPIADPPLPPVRAASQVNNEIDRFVLAALDAKGLTPDPPADKATLVRRAYFDLLGLPPTPAQVDEFLSDSSPDAFARLVDRLLASPHYGERWGRYWLDVARYADEQLNSTENEPIPNAFRYRDWVIEAFNADMPYDRFVKAQLAGDRMEPAGRYAAGLGLYALSPKFQDDRIDATTRGFLGLTVACAECHHHKFDPIPTEDYYALLGIFRSTRADEFPLAPPEVVAAYKEHKARLDQARADLDKFLETEAKQLADVLAARSADYIEAAWDVLGPAKAEPGQASKAHDLDLETLERWVRYLGARPRQHPLLDRFDEFVANGAGREAVRAFAREIQQHLIHVIREKKRIDAENFVRLGGDNGVRRANEVELLSLERDDYFFWRDLASPDAFSMPAKFESGLLYYKGKSIDRFLKGVWAAHVKGERDRLEALEASLPEKYPFFQIISDVDKPANERVHIRGSRDNLGDEVPRRFLSILSKGEPAPFTRGSGRLELAEAIVDRENPLTARVLVNRVWLGHFGQGIVRTPSNFGQTGDRPSHPELLDWLARRFMDQGWSIKQLHRTIMLSATYQRSSLPSKANLEADPENRLLWRYNRRRLDVESIRDSLLQAAGKLDLSTGGQASELSEAENHRRTVYGTVSRRKLETLLGLFDFPNPVSTSEQRIETNTPIQGLFFLNSEFVMRQAEALADRIAAEAGASTSERIRAAYRLLFGRAPTAAELEAGQAYLSAQDGSWPLYAQVLVSSNEFLYIE